eukprot:CAMPEP_0172612078 /NCGR_PEP_ID=MMETSP1068-20121228/31693_1 /TAXON_ID=35684 /ORGANISM="Pseudopedinella elastica, Strain CCMP716" /LENGTH=672 /DNA_ID=CAMNT_0013416219 /DNA_START=83 /DNA_END=2097 /DNA_ORIENTATION=-
MDEPMNDLVMALGDLSPALMPRGPSDTGYDLPAKKYYLGDVLDQVQKHGHRNLDRFELLRILRDLGFFVVSDELSKPASAVDINYIITLLHSKKKHDRAGSTRKTLFTNIFHKLGGEAALVGVTSEKPAEADPSPIQRVVTLAAPEKPETTSWQPRMEALEAQCAGLAGKLEVLRGVWPTLEDLERVGAQLQEVLAGLKLMEALKKQAADSARASDEAALRSAESAKQGAGDAACSAAEAKEAAEEARRAMEAALRAAEEAKAALAEARRQGGGGGGAEGPECLPDWFAEKVTQLETRILEERVAGLESALAEFERAHEAAFKAAFGGAEAERLRREQEARDLAERQARMEAALKALRKAHEAEVGAREADSGRLFDEVRQMKQDLQEADTRASGQQTELERLGGEVEKLAEWRREEADPALAALKGDLHATSETVEALKLARKSDSMVRDAAALKARQVLEETEARLRAEQQRAKAELEKGMEAERTRQLEAVARAEREQAAQNLKVGALIGGLDKAQAAARRLEFERAAAQAERELMAYSDKWFTVPAEQEVAMAPLAMVEQLSGVVGTHTADITELKGGIDKQASAHAAEVAAREGALAKVEAEAAAAAQTNAARFEAAERSVGVLTADVSQLERGAAVEAETRERGDAEGLELAAEALQPATAAAAGA